VAGKWNIVGHGTYERQVTDLGRQCLRVAVRRFYCTGCHITFSVGPCDLLARRQYTLAALALAVSLSVLAGLSAPQIRAAVSVSRRVDGSSEHTWWSLRCWLGAMTKLFGDDAPDEAHACCHWLAAHTPVMVSGRSHVIRTVCGAAPHVVDNADWLTFIDQAQSARGDPHE
jgi:hypothetical protein